MRFRENIFLMTMNVTTVGPHFIGGLKNLPTFSAGCRIGKVFVLHVIGQLGKVLFTIRTISRSIWEFQEETARSHAAPSPSHN